MYELMSHLGVTVCYLLIVSLLMRNFSLLFWLGGLLGMNLLDIDHLFYLFTHSKEEACQPVFQMWREKKYQEAIFYLVGSHKSYNRKLLHNAFFAAVFALFAVLVVATNNGLFQIGLTLSIYLHLLKDIISDVRNMEHLKEWLFWPINHPISDYIVKIYIVVLSLLFFLLTGMLFRRF